MTIERRELRNFLLLAVASVLLLAAINAAARWRAEQARWTVVVIDPEAVPIVGAAVSVTMVRTGAREVCRTADQGACDVQVQMPVRLEVSAPGYEARTVVAARELESGYVMVLRKR